MFLSGAVKLVSGDPTWRNFTALPVHYQTQPLPTPLAWYFYQRCDKSPFAAFPKKKKMGKRRLIAARPFLARAQR